VLGAVAVVFFLRGREEEDVGFRDER